MNFCISLKHQIRYLLHYNTYFSSTCFRLSIAALLVQAKTKNREENRKIADELNDPNLASVLGVYIIVCHCLREPKMNTYTFNLIHEHLRRGQHSIVV